MITPVSTSSVLKDNFSVLMITTSVHKDIPNLHSYHKEKVQFSLPCSNIWELLMNKSLGDHDEEVSPTYKAYKIREEDNLSLHSWEDNIASEKAVSEADLLPDARSLSKPK